MKRILMVAVLAAALMALVASSVFAQGTAPNQAAPQGAPAYQGMGRGYGRMQAQGVMPGAMGQRMGRGGMMGQGFGRQPEWAGMNDVAEVLGLTVDQLRTKRQAGESLVEIAAAKGIDEAMLIEKLTAAREATIAELVAAGKITETQAKYMLANMAEHMKVMVEREGTGPAPWRGGCPMMQGRTGTGTSS